MDRKPACQESDRLLRKLGQAVKDLIRARQSGSARAALKAWREARKEFARHLEEHGC